MVSSSTRKRTAVDLSDDLSPSSSTYDGSSSSFHASDEDVSSESSSDGRPSIRKRTSSLRRSRSTSATDEDSAYASANGFSSIASNEEASRTDSEPSNEYSTTVEDESGASNRRSVSTRKLVKPSHIEQSPKSATYILDQITNDYQKCVRLGHDFRQKHRQLVTLYKMVSKLTLMWQETWYESGSSGSAPMKKLVEIVRKHGPHLLSDEELAGMKRTQDQIRNRMERMTNDVDRRFYSSQNPVFQSLSEDEKQEILHDKGRREELLRDQMRNMGIDVDYDENALPTHRHLEHYVSTLANEYFGEDVLDRDRSAAWSESMLDNEVGSSGQTTRSLFSDYVHGNELGAIPAGITDVGRYASDNQLLRAIMAESTHTASVTYILAHDHRLPVIEHSTDALSAYTSHLFDHKAESIGAIPDVTALLHDHPTMASDTSFIDTNNADTMQQQWNKDAYEWFARGYDHCLRLCDASDTSSKLDIAMVWHSAANTATGRPTLLSYAEAGRDDPQRVYWAKDDGHFESKLLNDLASNLPPNVELVVPNTRDASLVSTLHAYCQVLTTYGCRTRADVLYRLIWHSCIESGVQYPVVPTLPFVTGLRPEALEPSDLQFWYGGESLLSSFHPPNVHIDTNLGEMLKREGAIEDNPKLQDWVESFQCQLLLHTQMTHVLSSEHAKSFGGDTSTISNDPVHAGWHEATCAEYKSGEPQVKSLGGSTFPRDRLHTYADKLFTDIVTTLGNVRPEDVDAYKQNNTIVAIDYQALLDRCGPLLVVLYHQLGKTRTCPFVQSPFISNVERVFDDVVNALEMHMELFEHAVNEYKNLPKDEEDKRAQQQSRRDKKSPLDRKDPPFIDTKDHRKHHKITAALERYCHKDYFAVWLDDTQTESVIFSYSTFKAVFCTPQLYTSMRDTDPYALSTYLQTQLSLDIVDSNVVSVEYVLDVLAIVHNRAFGADAESRGTGTGSSASMVHLLRVLLHNLGIWELPLRTKDWDTVVEQHIDSLIDHPDHPFRDSVSVNDLLFGHPSPLALARLYVSGIQYCQSNERLPKDKAPPTQIQDTFQRTFDRAMESIRHPVFAGQLLRFRDLLLEQPNHELLYRILELANIALWNHPMLWQRLMEYGVAVNTAYNTDEGDDNTHYFQEIDRVLDVADDIADLDKSAIARAKKRLKEGTI